MFSYLTFSKQEIVVSKLFLGIMVNPKIVEQLLNVQR